MRWIPGTTIADLEKMAITDAMKFYQGRKNDAAEALGISTRTLYNKLEEYAKEDELKAEAEARDKLRRDNWLREQRGELVSPVEEEISAPEDFAVTLPKRPAPPTDLEVEEPQKAAGGRRAR
jgi:hypothetical protein